MPLLHPQLQCRTLHPQACGRSAWSRNYPVGVPQGAQNFRDPAFLGIMDPENDAVYLPLKQGRNELMLAVSELGGGWGFICRLQQ